VAPAPEPEVLAEALRLAREGEAAGVPLRLVGGVAVHAHARAGVHPAFARELNDIDLAVPKAADRSGLEFLESMGYEAERTFNAMNAGRRAMFWDTERDRKVDLFVGSLEMCHVVPLTGRIEADAPTIPLAELLLTKLQIVHLNEKDVRDTLAVLVEHEVGAIDDETINADEIAHLCAADWGLWRTVKLNIERVGAAVSDYPVSADEAECIAWRLDELWTRIEAEPKSRRWRARSKVGDRKRWYEEPEEVG
jgi:hypothetical protein